MNSSFTPFGPLFRNSLITTVLIPAGFVSANEVLVSAAEVLVSFAAAVAFIADAVPVAFTADAVPVAFTADAVPVAIASAQVIIGVNAVLRGVGAPTLKSMLLSFVS